MRCSLALVVSVACAVLSSCIHDRGDCPWNGDGSVSLRVNDGTGPIAGGASMCASGMFVNEGNRDRELQVCGARFEFTVALAISDYETGVRSVTSGPLTIGSVRVAFTALSDDGNAGYIAEPDATGSVTIDANSASQGGIVRGTITNVRLARTACSATDCTVFPTEIRLHGAFDARVR